MVIAQPKTKQLRLFDNQLKLSVSAEDWDYLCENVFYSDDPDIDDVESEFVTGTGVTPRKVDLWPEASKRFASYVDELRVVKSLDINQMCRDLILKEKIL